MTKKMCKRILALVLAAALTGGILGCAQEPQVQAPAEQTPVLESVPLKLSQPEETQAVTTAPTEPEQTTEPAETTDAPPSEPPKTSQPQNAQGGGDEIAQGISNESQVFQEEPAVVHNPTTVPSGTATAENDSAIIDYSNTADGYVMAKYKNSTSKRIKVQVKGPKTTYTFNLTPGVWAAFPLADENGSYKVTVFENVTGNKYAAALSKTIHVDMPDPFAPFLHSNQFVDFDNAPKAVEKADELCKGIDDPLMKVEKVYSFVVKGMSYDTHLAQTVKSGYVPVLDEVLEKMTGICFDYAAVMTGMLRSQDVPCKLVVGYAGEVYHAWISVWSQETGWVEGVVFFDGTTWQRMDPTFASSADDGEAILKYIGNNSNYTSKYIY